ncbi:unnamed protein product [Mesocestoides corti]|uniref:Uncharacterized protein n=1 Tax=Mesocestoides corti TaxID=53468 RepID=A0A0R3U5Q9_MESCO|nr:unnamed protein product [Mesocestoides corti]
MGRKAEVGAEPTVGTARQVRANPYARKRARSHNDSPDSKESAQTRQKCLQDANDPIFCLTAVATTQTISPTHRHTVQQGAACGGAERRSWNDHLKLRHHTFEAQD